MKLFVTKMKIYRIKRKREKTGTGKQNKIIFKIMRIYKLYRA